MDKAKMKKTRAKIDLKTPWQWSLETIHGTNHCC
jgi:hypothetical protein